MFIKITELIENLDDGVITLSRKRILQPLIDYIQSRVDNSQPIALNFICTHNSRRSHLGQIWAQTMADYYNIDDFKSFSGGTEATALFPKIAETLTNQGFKIEIAIDGDNPLYGIRYSDDNQPITAFSKIFNHEDNPNKDFAAIMTCDHASENCPVVYGADQRIAITYIDPKKSDGTDQQDEVYRLKSIEIATELNYVFSQIKK